MENKLKKHFPMIRTREEIYQEVQEKPRLKNIFQSWTTEQQNEFLRFCTGITGCKLLYDAFFKEIMDPESTPERLEEFLTLILKQKIRILHVLPNDSTRISDESSLVIMDIVVELNDGSIVNVEIQRNGYMFPGERSACYSADLLLRQYKRTRSEKKKLFSYRDIKNVYTIVLFAQSPSEFKKFPQHYIHHSKQETDTGVKVNLLQEYTFITLDIFRNLVQNKGVSNKLEAWLAFFSSDDPDMVEKNIREYPQFRKMYEEVYTLCGNVEKVMNMFSEELRELDRNTVQLMIDEMQEELDRQKAQLTVNNTKLAEQDSKLAEQDSKLAELDSKLAEQDSMLAEKDAKLAEQDAEIARLRQLLSS